MTIKYNVMLDVSRSSGSASLKSGIFKDMGAGEDIDDVLTLDTKWLIRPCSQGCSRH